MFKLLQRLGSEKKQQVMFRWLFLNPKVEIKSSEVAESILIYKKKAATYDFLKGAIHMMVKALAKSERVLFMKSSHQKYLQTTRIVF